MEEKKKSIEQLPENIRGLFTSSGFIAKTQHGAAQANSQIHQDVVRMIVAGYSTDEILDQLELFGGYSRETALRYLSNGLKLLKILQKRGLYKDIKNITPRKKALPSNDIGELPTDENGNHIKEQDNTGDNEQ